MNTTQGTDAWEKREAFIMTTTNKTSLKDKYVALIHAATEADDLIMIEVTLKNFVDYINSVIMMVFGAEIIKERYAPDEIRNSRNGVCESIANSRAGKCYNVDKAVALMKQ